MNEVHRCLENKLIWTNFPKSICIKCVNFENILFIYAEFSMILSESV